MDLSPDPSTVLDPHNQAFQRLIDPAVPQSEVASLVEIVFSNRKVADLARHLRGSEAQVFIDVIDEVRHHTRPSPRHWFIYLNLPRFVG